jgi:hypothetical protein
MNVGDAKSALLRRDELFFVFSILNDLIDATGKNDWNDLHQLGGFILE